MEKIEKQELFLKRQWTLLDAIRQDRTRFSLLACALNISITSFVIVHGGDESTKGWFFVALVILVTVLAFSGLVVQHLFYKHFNNMIKYLYDKMEIKGEDFFRKGPDETFLDNRPMWGMLYVAIVLTGVLCVIALLFAPIPVTA